MQCTVVFITGSVQGVGFRKFIKQNALKLQLVGWARNVFPGEKEEGAEGGVEALFCGEPKVIEQMLALCRKGPMFSTVANVAVTSINIKEEFSGFEIVM